MLRFECFCFVFCLCFLFLIKLSNYVNLSIFFVSLKEKEVRVKSGLKKKCKRLVSNQSYVKLLWVCVTYRMLYCLTNCERMMMTIFSVVQDT